MENASAAFLDAVRKSMRAIREALGATTVNPDLLTCAEKLQYDGFLRREEMNTAVLALFREGMSIKRIVRETGHSRKLVRQIVRGGRADVFRTRQTSLDHHLPFLEEQWRAGCRNGAELWRRLRAKGFRGSLRVVGEWATRHRQAEKASLQQLRKAPSARTIARLMTTRRDHLTKAERGDVAGRHGVFRHFLAGARRQRRDEPHLAAQFQGYEYLRIPTKPAMHSNRKPATCSNTKPARIPI